MPALRLTRLAPALLAGILSLVLVVTVYAQNGVLPNFDPSCTPLVHLISQSYTAGTTYNTNGLEPEYPIWCYPQPQAGAPTAQVGTNSWVDAWDNSGPGIQTLNDHDYGYRVFQRPLSNPANFKMGSFINTDHWMLDLVDVSPFRLSGGIMVSPDKTFLPENGTWVVEADAAQGAPGMGGANHFYEFDISPAPQLSQYVVDNLYGYGQFGDTGAIGCRFENPGIVCARYDGSNRVTGGECPNDGRVCTDNGGRPGRSWEVQGSGSAQTASSVRAGTRVLAGNNAGQALSTVMRSCADNVHDLHCRDRIRLELTKDSLHIWFNGGLVYALDGIYAVNPATGGDNRVPDSWFQSGIRFYMTSWINGGQHTPMRWHWNTVAVNPPWPATQAVSDSYCAGNTFNGSPNTCPHAHVQSCPELAPPGTTACTSAPQPTQIPEPTAGPTNTPLPTATPVATSTATPPIPTVTPTPVSTELPCIIRATRGDQLIWSAVADPAACN